MVDAAKRVLYRRPTPKANMSGVKEKGQASVEVLGTVPVFLLVALCLFQLLAAGYTIVIADNASQAAAIAVANGDDPDDAAREAAPGLSHKSVRVKQHGEKITVKLRPPGPIRQVVEKLTISSSAVVRRPEADR